MVAHRQPPHDADNGASIEAHQVQMFAAEPQRGRLILGGCVGLPPADALRAAHEWMTDPARRTPPGMPELFVGDLANEELPISAWGGLQLPR